MSRRLRNPESAPRAKPAPEAWSMDAETLDIIRERDAAWSRLREAIREVRTVGDDTIG